MGNLLGAIRNWVRDQNPESYHLIVDLHALTLPKDPAELRSGTLEYDNRRWKPGKLEPVADALWRASDGYLDVLDATLPFL